MGDGWKAKLEEVNRVLQSTRAKSLRWYGGMLLTGFIGAGCGLVTADIIKGYLTNQPSNDKMLDDMKADNIILVEEISYLKQDIYTLKCEIRSLRREINAKYFESSLYIEKIEAELEKK